MVDKFDLSSLKTVLSGAAPLSKELETAVAERLPGVGTIQQGNVTFPWEPYTLRGSICNGPRKIKRQK